ncbi:unnamed protein product [Cyprideis torosa]|uniref:Uncharacterized protein n=1 Tax=Cyprideis torosa TaxID=163714 RepID=A0A7R8ZRZ7_9CRUS|nr:unnamed protein product [Cyprideis torosa]CAG0895118.1 unnamed protein product [Cyprideis torosa]
MSYLFTSESVSEGHPDKIADQISDALVDHYLAFDPQSKTAIETLVTTGQVVLAGEVNSIAKIDVAEVARDVIRKIGYDKSDYMFDGNSCGILSAIHGQSPEINQGVVREIDEHQGAGDQGIMFGYANAETESYMPLALHLAHVFLQKLAELRREGEIIPYLRPDAKSQVTIEYSDDHVAQRVDTLVISTQHDPFAADDAMLSKIESDVKSILIPAQRLGLRSPIYLESAAYGHMGRTSEIKTKTFTDIDGNQKTLDLKMFPWEELNLVDEIKSHFS